MTIKTKHVLLVDDHHLVRKGIRMVLEDIQEVDYDVSEVDSGEKAVDYFKNNQVDVILMDITMDGMTGIEATQTITDLKSNAKVIALSMHDESYMIRQMLDAGASGYLLKDTDSSELSKAIDSVLVGKNYFSNDVSLKLLGEYEDKLRAKHNGNKSSSFQISKREIDVLRLIAKQMTNEEIAQRLGLSRRTVDSHRQRMLSKLGLKNTAGLIMYAIKNNLIEEDF